MSETIGINVVFTDLVGSTEMSSRLGPEATEELRVIHFGLLRGAMEHHGGTEVKNLGDGLMIVFPSLGSALDGSVAMQQAIDRHNSSGKDPLGVRVGVATGDATMEDGDYFGEPVVEAARLCAKCEAGQIIVSSLLAMIARSSGHTFTSIGDLELRGIPEPVPAMTVDWEPVEVQGAIPIPDRLKVDMEQPIAGRKTELDAMRQAFKDAGAGSRRSTFLVGEPGIGKTRLSSELAAEEFEHGAMTLYGRCDEELSLPYQPWVEALGYLIDNASDELLSEVIRVYGAELASMLPNVRRRFADVAPLQGNDPETERYLLLQAVTGLLSMVSADTPLLLVLDDLHWADKPTLTMLRHVFTNLSGGSLMIIGTYRDSDLEAGHPLIDTVAALRRETGVEQISVSGLDDAEMIELVTLSADHELDQKATDMALALRQETAGNPFFAHEILRSLVEVGDLYLGDDGKWVIAKSFEELALPQSVRDVVGQRIARLGDDLLKVLRAAAVIGKEFDLELLATVTDTDEDDLLDLLESAEHAGILAEIPGGEERFRFLHTVARNTLEGELSDGRKRRMHRRIAEALEEQIGDHPGARVGELATHWLAAAVPVESSKAINYARMAGQLASAKLAPDEAMRWFKTALEHLDLTDEPDEMLRAELMVELGTAEQHAGDPDYRQTLLEAGELARRLGATKLMVDSALANNRGLYSRMGTKDDERIAALEAALEVIGEERTAERSLLLGTLFSELEHGGTYDARMALIHEAIDIAREVDNKWAVAAALSRSGVTSAVPQNLEARTADTAESVALAKELGDTTLEFWATCGVFQSALGRGDVAAAEAALASLTVAAEEIGRPSFHWVAGNLRTNLHSAYGRGDEEELSATEAFGIGTEAGQPDAFDYYAATVMHVRMNQGRSMEIIDQLMDVARENPEVDAYKAVACMMYAVEGDADEARALLAEATSRNFDARVNNVWSTGVGAWAWAAAALEDTESASVLYDIMAPWSGQIIVNGAFVFTAIDTLLGRVAALLGRHDEAAAHFAAADELVAPFGASFFQAENDEGWARLCVATGDTSGAETHARRALETAQAKGYTSTERRSAELLATLGE